MDNADRNCVKIREHEFEFIAPDQLRFKLAGEFSEADSIAYLEFVFQHKKMNNGRLFSIYDLSKLNRVAEGARRQTVSISEPYPYVGMAVIAGTFSNRVIVTMVMRAGKLVAPERMSFAYKFVSSVEEASVWFDELRNKRI